MRRAFLLGAGFSKAVADGPLMNEIWDYMEKAYEKEKNIKILRHNNRLKWFEELNKFIRKLETEATCGFPLKEFDRIKVGIRENIEYLFTLIDLHLSGPEIKFQRAGEDISPYPVIPWRFISKFELLEIKSYLLTFLYTILVNLTPRALVNKFAEIIDIKDEIITFNYDMVLEKALWQINMWTPLNGYVGVVKFEKAADQKKLENNNKFSKIRIHKMHGSLCWREWDEKIAIELDNRENCSFYLPGLGRILERDPKKLYRQIEPQVNVGYGGKHSPSWILPSFIKPFEKREFFEIWKSALSVLSKTNELIIIGYSFRPADSNSHLLIASLPDRCKLTLVDSCPKSIEVRLKNNGIRISETYETLDEYLSSLVRHGFSRP